MRRIDRPHAAVGYDRAEPCELLFDTGHRYRTTHPIVMREASHGQAISIERRMRSGTAGWRETTSGCEDPSTGLLRPLSAE